MRILLIEPHQRSSLVVQELLRSLRHQVDAVFDGQDGYHYLQSGMYDAVLCGTNLPTLSEFQLMDLIAKELPHIAIVLFRDHATNIPPEVFVVPMHAIKTELPAVLQTLAAKQTSSMVLRFGDLSLQPLSSILRGNTNQVQLSPNEMKLMELLMKHHQSPLSKSAIIETVWFAKTSRNNVQVYISFLRKKLALLESFTTIKTVRNVGYQLEFQGESSNK